MNYKRYLRSLYVLYKSFYKKSQWKGDERIFCLSIQKTGTTSFGDFFVHFGYPVVRSNLSQLRNWNAYWFLGYHKLIFWDPVFRNYQVFEDAPFWAKDFYKVLQKRYPKAKFVLFTRNSEAWFNSMLIHNNGKIIGDKRFHAKNYMIPKAAEDPDFQLKDHRNHYIEFYKKRNQEILDFFRTKNTPFIHLELEDSHKWKKLGEFVGLEISDHFEIHSNTKEVYINKREKK